jgi:hypothetical protein
VQSLKGRAVACGLVVVAGALSAACSSYETVAREKFSSDRSCPLAGITAVEHPELSAHELIFGTSKPPPEIAADPARRAIWQEKENEGKARWDSSTKVFVVEGCKEKSYYTCSAGGKSGRSCSSRSSPKPP